MFKSIKTSKANRDIVAQLTKKLNLGTENVIARMSLTYSLSQNKKLNLSDIKDSTGKEYSKSVLLGENEDIYIGLICTHYGIYKTDKNISKYMKMHIDDGLELIQNEITNNPKLNGFDFIIEKIEKGIEELI